MHRIIKGLFVLLLLYSMNNEVAFAATADLLVRADENYPPYEFLDHGEPKGFNIDLIKAVADVMNLNITIDMGPWDEVRSDLEEGRIDALAGMYYSPERDKKVDFSIPHIIVSHSLFVRKDADISSLEDAKDKVILVQKNDLMHDYLIENNITSNIIPVSDQEEAIVQLANGEGDAALLNKLQAFYFMKVHKLDNVTAVGQEFLLREYNFAVKEGDQELQTVLNEGLNILKDSGRYKVIYDKWFGIYEEQLITERVRRIILIVLLPILGIFTLISIWTWSLKRQVNLKTQELQQLNLELEDRVMLRTSELETVNQELEDFAYIISHDLKAPLRAIAQLASWISEDNKDLLKPESKEHLELMINRVHRLDDLIQGVLAYSKAARSARLNEMINMDEVVHRVVEALTIDPNVTLHIQNDFPQIRANQTGMEEIFQNLISNALKHGDKANPSVAIGWAEFDDDWQFWVKDNGPGIDPKHHHHIFMVFQTLEPQERSDNTGVGLSIVKRIVENHQGRVWVDSQLGEGAAFYFTIPKNFK